MVELSTWQDVMDLFYGVTQDTEARQTWFTTSQLLSWANQCLAEMAEHANPVDKEIVWSATPGDALYEVNSTGFGTLEVKMVEVDDEQIEPTTQADLWKSSRVWQQQTGTPRYYYLDSLNDYTNSGIDIALWPTPDSANSIRVTLSVVPDAVDNDNMDNPVMLPLWAVPGLLWGMLSLAYKAETRLQNLLTAQLFRQMYDAVLDRLRARSNARVPQVVVYGSGGHGGHGGRDNWYSQMLSVSVPTT